MAGITAWLRVIAFFTCIYYALAVTKYYGKLIGEFQTHVHGVKGTVYAANENTFFIEGFEYDGQGPDAFFWGDTKGTPTSDGFIIPNEKGTTNVLRRYNGEDLIITLPGGKLISDIKSLSVWCRRYQVNFGHTVVSGDNLPKEKSLGPLPTLAHGVRSHDVVIKDVKTLFISNLYYDGAGPDAFFLVGKGSRPHSKGIKVPDENGSLTKLKGYQGKDIILRLPGDLTVFDIEWFGLYCIAFEQNFGHVMVPEQPNVPANLDDLRMAAAESFSTIRSRSANSVKMKLMSPEKYYGKKLGSFKTNAHDVKGTVYAASENTFYIVDFSYDGQGPDAYFWAGTTEQPSPQGFIVPSEFGAKQVLAKYTDQNIAITLPDDKKITDIKWLSVWCRKFAVNFGHIMIPSDFDLPQERDIGSLPSLAHDTRADKVIVKDAKTITLINLHYDGAAPDAFFFVGTGREPHPGGTKVPDENGSLNKLKGYNGKDVTLRLPGDLTVFDIRWFSLYCISYKENFGHIMMPEDLNVPADLQTLKSVEMKFENCEELFPKILQVSWKVLGQDLYIQLAGFAAENEYLSFGRSGSDDKAAMIGSDVAVAFFDKDKNKMEVIDYYLSAKSQCSQESGACPDTKLRGSQNIETLSWERTNDMMKVTFKRPLAASDGQDLSIPMSVPVSVVTAIGPLNSLKEVSFHPHYYNKDPIMIYFGRDPPQNRCKPLHTPESPKPGEKVWPPLKISGTTVFRAQIGPTGGDKGYTAITGHQSWGVAWWIDGLLIPEITVQRGVNYTFIVEGGDDPTNPASYHPLYITNSPSGGGGQFLEELGSDNHRIYAGVLTDNSQVPRAIGAGRLCEWKHKTIDMSEQSESFSDYKKTLILDCKEGEPGRFFWVPDEDTPDLVYYQCFTHRNLGWKIHVRGGNVGGAASHQSSLPSSSCLPQISTVILSVLIFMIFINVR